MMLVERHKCEDSRNRLFTTQLVHFLHENIHADLHTGVTDRLHAPYQLDNGPGWNGMGKIDAVRGNSDASQS